VETVQCKKCLFLSLENMKKKHHQEVFSAGPKKQNSEPPKVFLCRTGYLDWEHNGHFMRCILKIKAKFFAIKENGSQFATALILCSIG
jgi:hypothetical protein